MRRGAPLPLIGVSTAIRELRQDAEFATESAARVLVVGERGVGKGFLARVIHRHGPRRNAPFMTVRCAVVVETQLERQLFHGSQSNGTSTPALEAAHGGTLFLDSIGDLTLRLQARLMQFLDTFEVQRVGTPGLHPAG